MSSGAPRKQAVPVAAAPAASTRVPARPRLSLEGAIDLGLCGVLLAGLSLLARQGQPDLSPLTVPTVLVGGGLCILWAIMGRRGWPCHLSAMGTLAVVAGVLLFQAAQFWLNAAEAGSVGRMAAAVTTVWVVFCGVTLANLVQERRRLPQ